MILLGDIGTSLLVCEQRAQGRYATVFALESVRLLSASVMRRVNAHIFILLPLPRRIAIRRVCLFVSSFVR